MDGADDGFALGENVGVSVGALEGIDDVGIPVGDAVGVDEVGVDDGTGVGCDVDGGMDGGGAHNPHDTGQISATILQSSVPCSCDEVHTGLSHVPGQMNRFVGAADGKVVEGFAVGAMVAHKHGHHSDSGRPK